MDDDKETAWEKWIRTATIKDMDDKYGTSPWFQRLVRDRPDMTIAEYLEHLSESKSSHPRMAMKDIEEKTNG